MRDRAFHATFDLWSLLFSFRGVLCSLNGGLCSLQHYMPLFVYLGQTIHINKAQGPQSVLPKGTWPWSLTCWPQICSQGWPVELMVQFWLFIKLLMIYIVITREMSVYLKQVPRDSLFAIKRYDFDPWLICWPNSSSSIDQSNIRITSFTKCM